MSNTDKFNVDPEQWRKEFFGEGAKPDVKPKKGNGADANAWPTPGMDVLRQNRRNPPALPIEVFGDAWGQWILLTAQASACPPDYVVAPLLALASVLIGNARWPQAWEGWEEPPHVWDIAIGDSGTGKSPGADSLLRDVLPPIERNMVGDFPDRLSDWHGAVEADKAAKQQWKEDRKKAAKEKKPLPPMPKPLAAEAAPEKPRLRQHDTTVEQVAALLSSSAPKGLMMVRDEVAGWLLGMEAYNPAGRAFWLEAYGGRPYRVERRSHSREPIEIPRLVVSVYGGCQPERLSDLAKGSDDGLFARVLWFWPDPIPFRQSERSPNVFWAVEALDKLRELDLKPGNPPQPVFMPLTDAARRQIEVFGQMMGETQKEAGGLMRPAFGKARGQALRLSCILEWLWWTAKPGMAPPPDVISEEAFLAAAMLVSEYLLPMAERVFGDAGATEVERNAATLARWIKKERPDEVHVRRMQREVRLPGLRTAEQIKAAAKVLADDFDWLRAPTIGFGKDSKVAYAVNPRIWEE